MVDYTENSIFLDNSIKQVVNKEIEQNIEIVKKELESRSLKTNGYFIGSLSRREPSTLSNNSRFKLFSDMDFLIVVEKEDNENVFFDDITNFFESKNPEVKWSFIVIEKNKICNINSHMRKDLMRTIHNPIWKNFEIEMLEEYSLSERQIVEPAINAISCLYLHPNLWGVDGNSIYKDRGYYFVKSILESIRAIFLDQGIEVNGFYELYKKRFDKRIVSIVSPDYIEELVRERELFHIGQGKNYCVGDIVKKMMVSHYKINDLYQMEELFLDFSDTTIIWSFQKAIISLVMAFNTTDNEKKVIWLNIITLSVLNMTKRSLKYFEKYGFLGKINWDKKLAENTLFLCQVIKALYFFRFDYYHELFNQNTGTYRIPDLRTDKLI